jgi:hypothetical protein
VTPCIEWPKYRRRRGGYGIRYHNGKNCHAHRVAWEEVNGPIPEGMLVLHRCDNPPCVNTEHLFLGTNDDNMRDMISKRRHWKQKVSHCPQGHPYSGSNLHVTKTGSRKCKSCLNRRRREYYAVHGR